MHVKAVWAKNHCNNKQKSSLTVFIAVSSALMLLPGIFYGGLTKYSYSKNPADANEEQARSDPVEGGSRSGQILPSIEPSTSTNKKEGKEHEGKFDDFSDTSTDNDEELILDLNRTKHELLELSRELEFPPKVAVISHDLLKVEGSSDEEPVVPSPFAAKSQDILLNI